MKVSEYAKQNSISKMTVYRMVKSGKLAHKILSTAEIIVINEVSDDKADLMQDFVSLVTSFCARLYGKRRTKRKTEKLIKELENDS